MKRKKKYAFILLFLFLVMFWTGFFHENTYLQERKTEWLTAKEQYENGELSEDSYRIAGYKADIYNRFDKGTVIISDIQVGLNWAIPVCIYAILIGSLYELIRYKNKKALSSAILSGIYTALKLFLWFIGNYFVIPF